MDFAFNSVLAPGPFSIDIIPGYVGAYVAVQAYRNYC
jgi:hypothetical protein